MANKTKFLLHVCCAPCSTHVIDSLKEKLDITCYFYNPNIWPISEYRTRLKDARGFCRRVGMPIILGSYDSELWTLATRGFEEEPEGGKRCEICFYFRLLDTARTASRLGFDLFGTTLTISPHKNPEAVNEAGRIAGRGTGMAFCEGDYKKKDGFLRSIELSKKYHLYRQKYCGCRYSIKTPSHSRPCDFVS